MDKRYAQIFGAKMDGESLAKLAALDNQRLYEFVADAIQLCKPQQVKVLGDDSADIEWVRRRAIETGEEATLKTKGHTIHFDGPGDLARDPNSTKYLVPDGVVLGKRLNQIGRDDGLAEIRGYLSGAMAGRTAYVRFFSLGPVSSAFSISCVQVTDSAYVAHSEDLLYRSGYEQFRRLGSKGEFFSFLHSSGRVNENMVSVDESKRRIYIDIAEDLVYSVNTQYAGNTVGLKKLALRLAIRKADREGWLAEHMFVMGVHGPKGRKTYFTGAFPSACGKTSTAMLPGESIVGDDLAYFRVVKGEARTANVEAGIFGIIEDVNAKDDPEIFKALNSPGEVVFSNVLVKDGRPYWNGMGVETPSEGVNAYGAWHAGMLDTDGEEITPSHMNSRYTVRLAALANRDQALDDPAGVSVGGIIYGGRDSDTSVPVQQSFDWNHGIITMGASLESETTAATLGAKGVRKFDLMSLLQFLAIPVGKYIQNNLDFGAKLTKQPPIFSVNYFLKNKDGRYLNGKLDKGVWVKWMERRVHGEVDVIEAPTGLLPKYEDLAPIFAERLGKKYSKDDYVEQFTIRVAENLAKIERIVNIYHDVADTPKVVFEVLDQQKRRLEKLAKAKGPYVSPLDL